MDATRSDRHSQRVPDLTIRTATNADLPRLWALNNLPNIGRTADERVPLDLPLPDSAPESFPDLADIDASFLGIGGDFVVVAEGGLVLAMGALKPLTEAVAEVLRVRVHPARRREGLGRALMGELERRARSRGFTQLSLDTATNQPEAIAFYGALGFSEVRRETRPEWTWTLVYFAKPLGFAGPAADWRCR